LTLKGHPNYALSQWLTLTDSSGGLCSDIQGTTCTPHEIFSQLIMVGPVPVLIQVQYQVKAFVQVTGSLDHDLEATLDYEQYVGYQKMGFNYTKNGGWMPEVIPASVLPNVTYTIKGNAKGKADVNMLLAVEMTVIVDGIKVQVSPGGWLSLGGDFNVQYWPPAAGVSKGSTCIAGNMGLGLNPGLYLNAGLEIIDVIQHSAAICGTKVNQFCSGKAGIVTNCALEAFSHLDACAMANTACADFRNIVTGIVGSPQTSLGYQVLGPPDKSHLKPIATAKYCL